MSILVTGGKGFIGARIIKKLVEFQDSVVCMDLKTTTGRLGSIADQVVMIEGSVDKFDDLINIIDRYRIEKIAHMVYFSAEARPDRDRAEYAEELYRQMLIMNLGTFNIFEAARVSGIKKLIFPSSIAYHGKSYSTPVNEDSPSEATNLYGIGKHLVEVLAHEYNRIFNMEISVVRIPIVYGPGAIYGAMGCNLIATQGGIGRPVKLPYDQEQKVCLGHVDDGAEVIIRILRAKTVKHDVYHIGGHTTSFRELASMVAELVPGMEVTFTDGSFIHDWPYLIDNSRMKQDIGVQHRSLEQGFLELINLARQEAGLPAVSGQ